MRYKYEAGDIHRLKQQLLAFSKTFPVCSIYDSNNTAAPLEYGRYELLAGFGCTEVIGGNFDTLMDRLDNNMHWIFGYMGYEAHAKFNSYQALDITEAFFYQPNIVFYMERGSEWLHIVNNGVDESTFNMLMDRFMSQDTEQQSVSDETTVFEPCTPKSKYLENIAKIRHNILEGDYYEINYCQKFAGTGQISNPLNVFKRINVKSPTPFAAFFRNERYDIMCTSPERFIFKAGEKLVSQPIKGTNKRLEGDANNAQLQHLCNSEKEIAENVMIVDLVRNDMARICKAGSIRVEELFGTYPFALVNQMISTVSGILNPGTGTAEIFRALFPMGSMTGAPKVEVMKNIARYEDSRRGLYSGCIGYVNPDGDFDFNVVIRTIVNDRMEKKSSFHVGGAITYDSIPENEYEECLLKGKGLSSF